MSSFKFSQAKCKFFYGDCLHDLEQEIKAFLRKKNRHVINTHMNKDESVDLWVGVIYYCNKEQYN